MPQVSILIPNFNNGIDSSVNHETNLIDDLIQSLVNTLNNDPTELEIIALDDGSTDDGLETLRRWSQTPWPPGSQQAEQHGDQPVLRLIQREHRGVLAAVANDLVQESTGQILVRLDGDIVVLTENWAQALVQLFSGGPPDLGVIGPKQLAGSMTHSFGDWILHPKGYHHIGFGLPPGQIQTPIECDHVMGCFYCCKRDVYNAVGGYDETILRGQTIDFGLAARLKGYRCFAVPDIVFDHRHRLRENRATLADTNEGVEKTLARFEEKWGFDRLAPDLDVVAEKYENTPLLWNARVFSARSLGPQRHPGSGFTRPRLSTPVNPGATEWAQFAKDQALQERCQQQMHAIARLVPKAPKGSCIGILGCGTGLIAHLLAQQGAGVIAFDHEQAAIDTAQQFTAQQKYPALKPRFIHEPDGRRMHAEGKHVGLWVLWDYLETHPNPAPLLRDLAQNARPGAVLLATASTTFGHEPTATAGLGPCNPWELHGLLKNTGWALQSGPDRFGTPSAAIATAPGRGKLPPSADGRSDVADGPSLKPHLTATADEPADPPKSR